MKRIKDLQHILKIFLNASKILKKNPAEESLNWIKFQTFRMRLHWKGIFTTSISQGFCLLKLKSNGLKVILRIASSKPICPVSLVKSSYHQMKYQWRWQYILNCGITSQTGPCHLFSMEHHLIYLSHVKQNTGLPWHGTHGTN